MADVVLLLNKLILVLFLGIILSFTAKKLRIPDILLLMLLGFLLNNLSYGSLLPLNFSLDTILFINIMALVIILFKGAASFDLRVLGKYGGKVLLFNGIFIAACLVFLSVLVRLLFGFEWWVSIVVSSIITGPATTIIFPLFKSVRRRWISFLKSEAILNPSLEIIIPFMIFEYVLSVKAGFAGFFLNPLHNFLTGLIIGVGTGTLMYLILHKIFTVKPSIYVRTFVLTSIFLTYFLANGLKGSGVIAVTVLGLFIGNFEKKTKIDFDVESTVAQLFYILLIIILGSLITLDFDYAFVIKILILFTAFLLLRYLIAFSVFKKVLSGKEISLFTLINPKGVSPMVSTLFLLAMPIANTVIVFNAISAFIVLSLLLTSVIVIVISIMKNLS